MIRHKESTVSFTGHRPDKFGGYHEDTEIIERIKVELENKIDQAIFLGYNTFISGMAIGVDTWAAEIVLEKKKEHPDIKLVCAIPFVGQERRWQFPSIKRYNNIIDNGDEIVIVSDGSYSVEKMMIRNEWMVDNSNIVIAVWDGTKGGTANCVRYAKKEKREIWHIDPEVLKKLC
jgi:uncharacterized phage-like protein YoqJ